MHHFFFFCNNLIVEKIIICIDKVHKNFKSLKFWNLCNLLGTSCIFIFQCRIYRFWKNYLIIIDFLIIHFCMHENHISYFFNAIFRKNPPAKLYQLFMDKITNIPEGRDVRVLCLLIKVKIESAFIYVII